MTSSEGSNKSYTINLEQNELVTRNREKLLDTILGSHEIECEDNSYISLKNLLDGSITDKEKLKVIVIDLYDGELPSDFDPDCIYYKSDKFDPEKVRQIIEQVITWGNDETDLLRSELNQLKGNCEISREVYGADESLADREEKLNTREKELAKKEQEYQQKLSDLENYYANYDESLSNREKELTSKEKAYNTKLEELVNREKYISGKEEELKKREAELKEYGKKLYNEAEGIYKDLKEELLKMEKSQNRQKRNNRKVYK